MKRFFFIALAVLFVNSSCNQNNTAENRNYGILYGKTTEPQDTLYLGALGLDDRMILPEKDGTFKDTLFLNLPAMALLSNNDTDKYIYMEPGDEFEVEISGSNLEKEVILKSGDTLRASFISKKIAYYRDLLDEFDENSDPDGDGDIDPQVYLNHISNIDKQLKKLLYSTKDLPPSFVKDEERRINYLRLYELDFVYNEMKSEAKEKNTEFEIPQDFLDEVAAIPWMDSEDYRLSGSYRELCLYAFYDRVFKTIENDTTLNYFDIQMDLAKEFSDPVIKDNFAKVAMENIILSSRVEKEKKNAYMDAYLQMASDSNNINTTKEAFESMAANPAGSVSPIFENYEKNGGGTVSLADLKGKYVYIDIWATWCAPCIAEVPALQKLEHDFKGRNIAFVSISVDTKNDYGKWNAMVKEKQLSGIQLYATDSFDSDFISAYGISSIPRFILIGPEGEIVDANAKRPSDPDIKSFLESLEI